MEFFSILISGIDTIGSAKRLEEHLEDFLDNNQMLIQKYGGSTTNEKVELDFESWFEHISGVSIIAVKTRSLKGFEELARRNLDMCVFIDALDAKYIKVVGDCITYWITALIRNPIVKSTRDDALFARVIENFYQCDYVLHYINPQLNLNTGYGPFVNVDAWGETDLKIGAKFVFNDAHYYKQEQDLLKELIYEKENP